VSWEIAHPSPEQETPLHTGRQTRAALESAPRGAALGPPVAPVAPVPQLTLTTAVEAGELLLFRSDLRSTLEAVVVCAAGRALSAHPDVNVTVVERVGRPALVPATSSWVQLLVLCDDGLRAGAVDAGEARPLTDVRDAVAALVEELRGGRPPQPAEPAALSLRTFALSGAAPSAAVAPPTSSALAVGRLTGEVGIMQVGLSVDARVVDADQASRLLATVVRMLEHPYRRLR
jgi:pyruvate/2-oxoglutarate dehydrogenase complex dihydrolipoamide acyltransferase (E2) component